MTVMANRKSTVDDELTSNDLHGSTDVNPCMMRRENQLRDNGMSTEVQQPVAHLSEAINVELEQPRFAPLRTTGGSELPASSIE